MLGAQVVLLACGLNGWPKVPQPLSPSQICRSGRTKGSASQRIYELIGGGLRRRIGPRLFVGLVPKSKITIKTPFDAHFKYPLVGVVLGHTYKDTRNEMGLRIMMLTISAVGSAPAALN